MKSCSRHLRLISETRTRRLLRGSGLALLVSLTAVLLQPVSAAAAVINILNPGFEAQAGNSLVTPITSWGGNNSWAFTEDSRVTGGAHGGTMVGLMNFQGYIYQDLKYLNNSSVLALPNEVITFDFYAAATLAASGGAGCAEADVYLVTTSNTGPGDTSTWVMTPVALSLVQNGGAWEHKTQQFVLPANLGALANAPLRLLIGTPLDQLNVDDFSATATLTSTVPEPSTVFLLLAGGALVWRRPRGRR